MEKMQMKTIMPKKELEAYREEQLQLLKSDVVFYNALLDLGLNEAQILNQIALFIDYHEDKKACENCLGLSFCKKERPYTQLCLVKEDEQMERKIRLCPYMQKRRMLEKQFLVHDFPDEWFGKSLENKDVDIRNDRGQLIRFMAAIVRGTSLKNWLYLHGKTRLGKSYVLAVLCQELIAKHPHQTCAYLKTPSRFKELSDLSFVDKAQMQEKLNTYIDADILVLDDFGNEYQSDFVRDTILNPLLDARSKSNKITMFTSRYTLNELIELHGKTVAGKIKMKRQVREVIENNAEIISLNCVSVY